MDNSMLVRLWPACGGHLYIRVLGLKYHHIHLCTFCYSTCDDGMSSKCKQEHYIPGTAICRCFLLAMELGGHILVCLTGCVPCSTGGGGGGSGDGSAGDAWGLPAPRRNPDVEFEGRAGVGGAATPVGYGVRKIVGGMVPSGLNFRGRPRFLLGGLELTPMACTCAVPAAGPDGRGVE